MPNSQPNILLLLSDQHNYRCLSHREDSPPVQTPTINDLARSGTNFSQAYTPSPLCVPSRYCLLTGREARDAGGWGHEYVLPPGVETIPETLSEAGYETCLQGKMHLGGTRQFAGFDYRPYGDLTGMGGHQHEPPGTNSIDLSSYIDDVGPSSIPESMTQERRVNEESLAFLRELEHRDQETPWFLCASYCRPHWPRRAPQRFIDRYDPSDIPPPEVVDGDATGHPLTEYLGERYGADEMTREESMRARAAYFACVDFIDEVIRDLLVALENDGFLENTIVVYASDHGDMIGEYERWEKHIWHDESTRVPLCVQLPSHRSSDRPGNDVSTPVSLIDLYPTLCNFAGVEPPADLDGYDLSDSIRGIHEPDRGPVYVDYLVDGTDGNLEYRMVRDGRYKYVRFRDHPDFFFDLKADPHEQRNLQDEARGERSQAHDRLKSLADESLDFEAAIAERQEAARLTATYKLGAPTGTGNAYQLENGRVVDADTPLYHPHVLVENPDVIYDDYPGEDDSASPPDNGSDG